MLFEGDFVECQECGFEFVLFSKVTRRGIVPEYCPACGEDMDYEEAEVWKMEKKLTERIQIATEDTSSSGSG